MAGPVNSKEFSKIQRLCVKCKVDKGKVAFPFSEISSKLWSKLISVPWKGRQIKHFSGRQKHSLCEVRNILCEVTLYYNRKS
jgi:hypothetical protein